MSPGPVLAGPGFDGTPRPGALASVTGLARLYAALLDRLDVWDVTVIGNSVGGWIAAELALLNNPRVSGAILINAVGIEVEGHPVTDISRLSPQQVMALSFHDPGRFTSDPGAPGRAPVLLAAGWLCAGTAFNRRADRGFRHSMGSGAGMTRRAGYFRELAMTRPRRRTCGSSG